MKEKDFNEFAESIRQAGKIRREERSVSRKTVLPEPDVVQIRKKYRMNQREFAALLGINVGTLRNWEQGRRKPHGPARVLLRVAEKKPQALLDSLTS